MKLLKIKNNRILKGVVGVFFLLLAAVFIILHNADQKKKTKAMELIGLSPVPGMKIKNCHIEGAMDWHVQVKIDIDREHLEDFLNQTPFKGKELSSSKNYTGLTGSYRWWTAHKAKNFLSGEYFDIEQGEAYKILIDLDDDKKVVIYIKWFET